MNYYEKIKSLYEQIDDLVNSDIISSYSKFKIWHNSCIRALTNAFGESSIELKSFKNIKYHSMYFDDQQNIIHFKEGLKTAKGFLADILEDFEQENNSETTNDTETNNNVFVVHGHQSDLKYQISNLLRKIGLNPIILHEQLEPSITIIEKIEKYGKKANSAVILFTPDDLGNAKNEEERKARARQNVVFEAGYFMGLLGREKTVLIVSDSSFELPGDLSGVVYSSANEWEIARSLKAMGLDVDMNKI